VVWALIAVVVAAAAITAVLSVTLRTRVLDRAAVQRDVAAQFRDHEGVAIRLDCADSMPLATGATYRCQGTTAAGEHVTLLIRVTDARTARYTWSEQR
jgi:Tfp pilus assembly protein PilV